MTTERTMKKFYGPSGFVAPKPQEERSELAWEYHGDGLYLYWQNPFNGGAKEDVVMFMWPSHAPEVTAEVERIYESMAQCFVAAWNRRSAALHESKEGR